MAKLRKNQQTPATMAVCFLYLDDSTESNGAISLIPGSHKYLNQRIGSMLWRQVERTSYRGAKRKPTSY